MNLTYRYYRNLCEGKVSRNKKRRTATDRAFRLDETGTSWYSYMIKLAKQHEKLIAKYHKSITPEEVYTRMCVIKLPLTNACKKQCQQNCKSCIHDDRSFGAGLSWTERSMQAMTCWIGVLENTKKNLEPTQSFPSFLKKKRPGFLD